MKKILITGANSYVGTNVEKWLMKEPDKFHVETLDMQLPKWKAFDFSGFDVVLHVAGIAHVSTKKNMDSLYYKVNRDLAIETAIKAEKEKVKQFIFMSSMIIYGEDNSINIKDHINIHNFNPLNAYGKSKLEADLAIQKLESKSFKVVIIRTPIIYGAHSKGNFSRLLSLSNKMFIVPKIKNQRSMIYITNFAEFIKQVVIREYNGIFYPQNSEYMETSKIITLVRRAQGKKVIEVKFFNLLIIFLTKLSSLFRKVYGNKTYDMKISKKLGFNYNLVDSKDSIIESIS